MARAHGRAWLVGGVVRDGFLGLNTGDLDLEVFGLSAGDLRATLEKEFELDLVGQSFGIIKLRGWPIDVGLPRREAKIGLGHKGFEVNSDPDMSLKDAAARRDFTINAVYLDPLTGEVEDPFGGLDDLAKGKLRHTSTAFGEDPLRVLRGMQLAARFDLQVVPETVDLCRSIEPEGLTSERIFGEWTKLITLGKVPSRGLAFLKECGWLQYYPELAALPGVPQDPNWHPEGDVWVHTLHCLDAFAAEKVGHPWEDLVVGLAVLCHDLGKPDTTTCEDDVIRSLGHEKRGVAVTGEFLGRMTNHRKLLAEVKPLVAEHMRPTTLFKAKASDAAVRRLAARVGRIDRLVRVARADVLGRPPLASTEYPAGDWLLEAARRLDIEKQPPEPLVLGRHLVDLGQQPGPDFGGILAKCYESQLAGKFTTVEAGIHYAEKLLRNR
ncbi:MAG: polynucleotide adenylyltransferase [Candidatus Krumholzibacteria bacterium]|nr:polynucleotide adenylyltransferase [Candidatus Krumholzibacteria bacterium]